MDNYFLHLIAWHFTSCYGVSQADVEEHLMCREYSSTSKTLRWLIWSCLRIWLVMKNTEVWCAGHKDIRKQNHPFEFLASVWRSSYDNQLLTVWPELKGWMYPGHQQTPPFHLFHLCCCSCVNWMMIFSHMLVLTCLTCLISTPAILVFLLSSGLKLVTGCVSVELLSEIYLGAWCIH